MQGGSGAVTKHRGWRSSIAVSGSVAPLPLVVFFLPCPLPLGAAKSNSPLNRTVRGVRRCSGDGAVPPQQPAARGDRGDATQTTDALPWCLGTRRTAECKCLLRRRHQLRVVEPYLSGSAIAFVREFGSDSNVKSLLCSVRYTRPVKPKLYLSCPPLLA